MKNRQYHSGQLPEILVFVCVNLWDIRRTNIRHVHRRGKFNKLLAYYKCFSNEYDFSIRELGHIQQVGERIREVQGTGEGHSDPGIWGEDRPPAPRSVVRRMLSASQIIEYMTQTKEHLNKLYKHPVQFSYNRYNNLLPCKCCP